MFKRVVLLLPFFHVSTLVGMTHPPSPAYKAQYLGMYENNDSKARLMVIVNFKNDAECNLHKSQSQVLAAHRGLALL